jgi:uncharacterized protein
MSGPPPSLTLPRKGGGKNSRGGIFFSRPLDGSSREADRWSGWGWSAKVFLGHGSRAPQLVLALLLFLVLLAPARTQASGPTIPPLSGRVVDLANLMDEWTRNHISGELENFEKQSGTQLVVVTLPDLGGYTIEDWGIALGRGWGIGQKGKNNGLLLIVAPNDREVRIEVGYGLEGDLPDATANEIIQKVIVPRFRNGDMAGGVTAGVEAIIQTLGGKPVAEIAGNGNDQGSGQAIAILPIIFLFIMLTIFLSNMRRRRYGMGYPFYMGGPTYMGGMGRGGFGGGFGGGGGFSGGGGSFGGGGASGHW